MSKKLIIGIVAVVVLVLLVGLPISTYNTLVSKQTAVEGQSANIDAQLQRRMELIPNLVETVKGFTQQEKEVFDAVNKSRQALLGAGSMEQKAAANDEMTVALNRLIAVAEAYPELKSDTVYVGLMDELAGTENRIAYARTEYNSTVRDYNQAIRKFPAVLLANIMGFEKAGFFEAAAGAQTAPTVDFTTQ